MYKEPEQRTRKCICKNLKRGKGGGTWRKKMAVEQDGEGGELE